MADAYWIGQDGNYYLKSPQGIQNLGSTLAPLSPAYIDSLEQIRDPALPPQTTTAPTGGAVTAPKPQLNQAAVNNTQMTLDQLPALLQAALEAENARYGNTTRDFDTQEAGQRKVYDESTTTNQLNYDETYMDSIRAGIKGLGGLMNILRGTGASGGSVEGDVRDIVGVVTAQDIRGGADTRNENQTGLDRSLEGFIGDLKRKRQGAEDTRVNNERAIRRDSATQMQDLLGKMAGFYGDAGRTAERDTFMTRAGQLTPEIAQNSRSQVSNYDTAPIQVQAPQLTAFTAPSQPDVATAPENGQVGSGIFTMTDRRRRESTPVAAGV